MFVCVLLLWLVSDAGLGCFALIFDCFRLLWVGVSFCLCMLSLPTLIGYIGFLRFVLVFFDAV